MAKKRVTPPEDYERFAQNLINQFVIADKKTYDLAFDTYMEGTITDRQEKLMRPQVWSIIQKEELISLPPSGTVPPPTLKTKPKVKRRPESEFIFTGRVGGKVVKARRIRVGGRIVYRDRRGRFVSVKVK